MEKPVPVIDQDLVEYLSKIFPDTCPEPDWTEREVWIRRGAVGVIRHLQSIVDAQNENILEM